MSEMDARGSTLVEALVAAFLGLIVLIAGLTILDAARRLFDLGGQAAESQQQVRQGFDLMIREIGLAGLGARPDGSAAPTDEAIEGAWGEALVFRADLDGHDRAGLATDPESLIGGAAGEVTTGNDEIVGYILRPVSGGGSSILFDADVGSGFTVVSPSYGPVAIRDGVTEPVTIGGVSLVQDTPPFTLYRVTLSNSATSFGGGNFVRVAPVADNIRSMMFRYFDRGGNELTPPGGSTGEESARAAIRNIRVDLVGMTPDPDIRWVDPLDPVLSTRHHRKFALSASVSPLNLGSVLRDDPPPASPWNPAGIGH